MQVRVLAASLLSLCMMGGLTGCISGGKRFAYVTGMGTNEIFQFQIQSNGGLMALNPGNTGVGSGPSSVAIRPAGDFAYITNFAGNNVTLLALNKGNGQLTVPATTVLIPPPTPPNIFNTGTGPIATGASPGAPFLYILNASSNDISGYVIDPATGNLQAKNPVCAVVVGKVCQAANNFPTTPAPGMAITPKGDLLFVANPALSSISVFSVSSTGDLSAAAGSPISLGAGTTPAGLAIEASGRFLYVADKANNRILGFAIQSNGALNAINGSPFAVGAAPVSVAINSQGAFLFTANHGSNDVSAFLIDSNSGTLATVSGSPFGTGGRGPTYVTASGSFVYVTEQTTNDVAAFSIGSSGTLTAAPGSPFNVPTPAQWIALARE